MADIPTGTTVGIHPKTITFISNMLQQTLREESLSMQNLPWEYSLKPYEKFIEWTKVDAKTGIDYQMNVHKRDGVSESETPVKYPVPASFFNKILDYDSYRSEQADLMDLAQRMAIHMENMKLRMDLINYRGDTVTTTDYAIDDLISATPGTEFTTQLTVASTAVATTSLEAACSQLKTALKKAKIGGKNSQAVLELTPSFWTSAAVKSTNEDFNARDAFLKVLRDNFSESSYIVENWILDATVTINSANVHTISHGSNLKALLYIKDPRIMKVVASQREIRQSNLDPTEGITVQPVQRHRRVDVEPLGVLVETGGASS